MLGFHFRRAQDRPQGELLELARLADDLGYSTIWASEAWGRDAFTLLTRVGDVTSRTRVATGIVNAWGRTPGTLAQTIATLDEATGGRAVLGLGVSGPKVVEDWHGLVWDHPLTRLREVTDIVRLALSGERVNYSGRHFELADFRLQFTPIRAEVPIYWGVYGPHGIRTAGALADGWVAGEVPLARWPSASAPFREAAADAGRQPSVSFMLQVTACETEEELEAARHLMRRDIAFRLGGLGPFHRRSLAEQGFAGVVNAVVERWASGDRASATAAVTDDLVESMGCVGGADDVRKHIADARAAGIEEPVVTVPRGTPTGRIAATLTACAEA